MIDRKWIEHEFGRSSLDVERGRLKFFAKAIGETDPIYFDEASAKAAGYADIPAPLTFLFTVELDSNALFALVKLLGVSLAKVLHGEQGFEYFSPLVAGDTAIVRSRVKDIYDKRGGALEFVETESTVSNQHGDAIAKLRSVFVVRN